MEIYRLCRAGHADLSGTGAKLFGGRWNSRDKALVYCSEHRSLAALEYLAHFINNIIPDELVMLTISVETGINIEEVKEVNLPANWKDYPPIHELSSIGDEWIKNSSSVILKVPSVIIDYEYNYLINPLHKDFDKISITKNEKIRFDGRFMLN